MKKVLLVAAIAIGLTAADGLAQVPVHLVYLASDPQTQDPQKPATSPKAILHGQVVDARTGEAIAKVKVIASGTEQSTTTDENGAFMLENLPVGQVELYITTVTFGLVKKTITFKEGDNKDYSRLDVRVSKAFLFKKWKLTLTGEVLNVLNRSNVRYAGFDFFRFDGRVFGQLDRVLPIVPSGGIVIEF